MNSADFDGIVVIQCAGSKRDGAGTLKQANGAPVKFVANPKRAMHDEKTGQWYVYARPDNVSDNGESWRERLLEYNARYRKSGENPFCLLPAWELYSNPIYRKLVETYGVEYVHLHSAGWGLIRSDFLMPKYNITFSTDSKYPVWSQRAKRDCYADFCHLPSKSKSPIVFFGGKDYVPLFSKLTQEFERRKIVFYNSKTPPAAPGCELKRYHTKRRQNWHYECAKAFIDGRATL